ncbi:rRNA maturation RNase YbeY [Campylobacter sp.]|uniref:rRNA maturation RNase YbeY n=1 Tax=Campylobacter sp. TaxID=205 RepID=UPI002A4EA922|nr:rRNA maturation RNase YbeY [Campylobacter sp.]MDD7089967.1 rRNA maturation RNase YbeY [Campylobacteraceae bacterium]MDY5285270.1 rRNA maturation RNase YbeY [Campylobacter sp.]
MIFCECEFDPLLEQIADFLGAGDVELVFVNNDEMRKINREQRGIDKATDVLSFPYEQISGGLMGSVVISTDTASRVASELGHSIEYEIALLFLHGVLHILGYDHEIDNGQMRQKEKEVIEHFSLPDSLIIRNS